VVRAPISGASSTGLMAVFRAAGAAVAGPVAATAVNELVPHANEASAAVYMLAVIGAALVGGLMAGIVAAVLSSVLEFFFFTTPSHSFSLRAIEDVLPSSPSSLRRSSWRD
jgi:K+-sensing histidine kinase KdpD